MRSAWRLGGLRQVLMFYGVGAVNTLVDFGLFWVLSDWFAVSYLAAQMGSYAAGACTSYLLNRTLTFRRAGQPWRFVVVNAFSLAVAALALLAAHGGLHAGLLPAKVAATALGSLVNYAGNSRWAFPGTATRQATAGPAPLAGTAPSARPRLQPTGTNRPSGDAGR